MALPIAPPTIRPSEAPSSRPWRAPSRPTARRRRRSDGEKRPAAKLAVLLEQAVGDAPVPDDDQVEEGREDARARAAAGRSRTGDTASRPGRGRAWRAPGSARRGERGRHRSGPRRVPFAQRLGVAGRHVRIVGIAADQRARSSTSGRICGPRRAPARRDAPHLVEPEGVGRALAAPDVDARRDADLGEVDARRGRPPSSSSAMKTVGAASRLAPMRFCARSISSAPVTTRRTRRTLAQRSARAVVPPGLRHLGKGLEVHRTVLVGIARQPRLLGREGEDRREPGDDAAEGLGRSPSARSCGAGSSIGSQ